VAFLIAISTFVPTLNASQDRRAAAVTVWTIVHYHAAVHIVFAAPHWRYALVIIPALVAQAALGIDSWRMNRKHAAGTRTI